MTVSEKELAEYARNLGKRLEAVHIRAEEAELEGFRPLPRRTRILSIVPDPYVPKERTIMRCPLCQKPTLEHEMMSRCALSRLFP